MERIKLLKKVVSAKVAVKDKDGNKTDKLIDKDFINFVLVLDGVIEVPIKAVFWQSNALLSAYAENKEDSK